MTNPAGALEQIKTAWRRRRGRSSRAACRAGRQAGRPAPRFELLEQRTLLSVAGAGFQFLEHSASSPAAESASLASIEEITLAENLSSITYTDQGIRGRIAPSSLLLETVEVAGTEFLRLDVPGWSSTGEPGRPELPVFRTSLTVPDGVEVIAGYTIENTMSLGTGHLVYPAQIPSVESTTAQSEFAFDAEYYGGSPAPTLDVLSVGGPAVVRGTGVVLLEVSPFQYDPVEGRLELATDLTFSLDFVAARRTESRLESSLQGAAAAGLTADAAEADYLIVTADAFHDEVLPLAQWKQKKGFRTHVATLGEVGNTSAEIYAFIDAAYHTGNTPSYLLLVGDHGDLPAYVLRNETANSDYVSDQPYACVDGDDYFADLALGRLPVNTDAEAAAAIDKILAYDRTPDGGSWYDDVLISGFFQDHEGWANGEADRWFMETAIHAGDYLHDVRGMTRHTALTAETDAGPPFFYRDNNSYPHRISVSGDSPYPVPGDVVDLWTDPSVATSDVASALEGGVGLVQYRGHGTDTGWQSPPFYRYHVDQLANGAMTPVVFSIACDTGGFDYPDDTFAEALLQHANGGAVGVLAGTGISYSGYNDLITHGIYTGLWPDYDPSHTGNPYPNSMRPAEALDFGKYYLYTYYGDSETTELEFNQFEWFGDPEMMLRSETPAGLSVVHPDWIEAGTSTDVTIRVAQSGADVEGALVCISRPGTDDYWVGTTDPGAEVTFAGITLSQIGDYDLVVTALDAVPFEGAIGATDDQPASVTGRYVFYNNSSFDGNDVGANVNDDGAIAPDPLSAGDALGKTALLPGGTADFRNYTSYSRGINGIMVDIEGLPQGVTALDAGDDFTFRVGNSSDLNSWSTAAPPESITLRGSEGQPTRVTIIWTDGEIQNEWLEVTVKDTDSTGLAEADVFYFGNITGETGDDGADALVTYSDLIETRNDINLTSVVDVDNKFDFNRDTYIDYSDLILCRNNINLSAGLNLITVPGVVPLEPEGSIGEALLHDAAIQDVAKANPAATGFPAPDTSLAELMWFYGQEQLTARNLSSAEYGQAESAVDKLLATWP